MTAFSDVKILFVDDDPSLLQSFARQFRGHFSLNTAASGAQGLEIVQNDGPFAVVISDMRMPEMNGIQFLTRVREMSPDTVRIMLTGNADIDTAMHAVNQGNIFRFLQKPCRKETIEWAVEAGIQQFQLITAEKELLEKTLKGSVQMLVEVLSLASPLAFSRAARVKEYVAHVVRHLKVAKAWEVEIAALLSQIGWIALPTDVIHKVHTGNELTPDEEKMFTSHPVLGGKIVSHIPRLEEVGRMIAGQLVPLQDTLIAPEKITEDPGVLGAQILKTCIDFDTLLLTGMNPRLAIARLHARETEYHPLIVEALGSMNVASIEMEEREVQTRDLTDSMVLAQDVYTKTGILLAPKGHKVNLSLRTRLENYSRRSEIDKKLRVSLPSAQHATTAPIVVPTKV